MENITEGQEVIIKKRQGLGVRTPKARSTHLFIKMSSSSQTRSCTTVSAEPSSAGSKLSSPSRLARDTIVVAVGGIKLEIHTGHYVGGGSLSWNYATSQKHRHTFSITEISSRTGFVCGTHHRLGLGDPRAL